MSDYPTEVRTIHRTDKPRRPSKTNPLSFECTTTFHDEELTGDRLRRWQDFALSLLTPRKATL